MSLKLRINHQVGTLTMQAEFSAPQGVTVLFGRSGAGKSSIVNAVAGLLTPRDGYVSLDRQVLLDTDKGINRPPHKRGVGYVFQEGRLFPHLNVQQNLNYGRWFSRNRSQSGDWDRVVDILGLGPLLTRRPGDLSGGEKQRVAIGRALLAAPRLILADEPLAALDEGRKAEIMPYFERLRDEIEVPILYVTHSAAEVARLATTVIALQDGRVARQGPAMEVMGDPMVTPAGARAAGAVLEAVVHKQHDDGLTELVAGGISLFLPKLDRHPGDLLRVRIAAHEIMIARTKPEGISALNVVPGTVETLRAGDGPGMMVSLGTPAGRLLARITRRSAHALGLEPNVNCYAIIKSIAIAPQDVGRG